MSDRALQIENDFLGFIPELPEVAQNFINLTRQPDFGKKSYASFLLSDAVLSSRLFSFINLTLCHGNKSFVSINKGISIYGVPAFANIVMVFSLFPVFEEAKCIDLFKYSLSSSFFAKKIAQDYELINQHDAFIMSFLHNVGKIVFKNKFGSEYPIHQFPANNIGRELSIDEEIKKFGYSHPELSEFILKKWHIPNVICNAIRHHHSPEKAMLPQASSIIYIADILCKKYLRLTEEDQEIFNYMQISKSDLAAYTPECERRLAPYFEVLNI